MVVISGEVGCCCGLFGSLVGRFWLRNRWEELVMASAMVFPL